MIRRNYWGLFSAGVVVLCGAMWVAAQDKKAKEEPKESERSVKETEVPAAALAALKKLAAGAAITEFAEEIEHGHKYYEGSWKGADGNIDGLVTEAGDVVELEETVAAPKVPAGVRAAMEKEAGAGAALVYERKTVYFYEAHFKKDGKGREVIMTADARVFHEEGGDEDEDEKEGDDDDRGGDDDDDDDGHN